jgi:hydroxymethylglutaryl-CoA lyase
MADLPKSVKINEEGPREGFQIEPTPIPTPQKIEFIDALSEAGLKHIQTVSFVNPKRVPAWADADEVARGFRAFPGVHYTALWLNSKGMQRALAFRDKLHLGGTIRVGASEPFMLRNQGTDFAQNLTQQRQQVREYIENDIPVDDIGITAAFGCNFAGEIPISRVLEAIGEAQQIADEAGVAPKQIRLSDTMAWATPDRVRRTVAAVRERYPGKQVHLHLHDTRGMAIANAYAGLEMGVASYDSAIAGLGGCPFAGHAGAAGNICTEDLVFLCEEMGIDTGIDLDRLIAAARLAERIFGRPLPGSVMHGGTLDRFRKKAA